MEKVFIIAALIAFICDAAGVKVGRVGLLGLGLALLTATLLF